MTTQQREDETELKLEFASLKRNPCLADYRKETSAQRQQRSKYSARRAIIRRQRRMRLRRIKLAGVICLFGLGIFLLKRTLDRPDADGRMALADKQLEVLAIVPRREEIQGIDAKTFGKHPAWTEDFLTPNEYSRPGEALTTVNNIFVHYTANQGTSAAQNRSYFEQLKDTHERSASAHFIIGYEGEIVQCIPLDEIAYAVQTRNQDSISIECCYLAEDGSFTQETYDSLVALLKWLTEVYDLETEDILRHYDCGGKKCPIYYTEHEDAWEKLKKDVKTF